MPTATIYLRYSDKIQERGDSIRRQTELADAVIERRGLIRGRVYQDLGVSSYRGRNSEKGALFSYRADVRAGRISSDSWLLIEDFDRLSRQVFSKVYPLFTELVNAGITICTTTDDRIYNRDNQNDLDIILVTLLKIMTSNQESKNKSKRLTDLWKERREKDWKSAVCPAWLQFVDGEYIELEGRWKTVRRIFNLAESGLGSTSIVKVLNSDPETPPFLHEHGKRGQRWHSTTVDNILTGRRVLGEYQPCKVVDGKSVPVGDAIPDRYPAVITEGQWGRVQALRKTKPKGKRSDTMSNLFTGKVVCRHCEGPMRVKPVYPSKKRQHLRVIRYFVCSNAMNNHGCDANTYFPLDEVENAILDHLPEYRLHEIFADPRLHEELTGTLDQIAAYEAKIADLERGTVNLNGRIAKLEPDDPAGDSMMATVRAYAVEIKQMREAIKALEQRRLTQSARIDQRADAEGNVRALRAEMARAEGGDLLALRAKLSYALQTFVRGIKFDSKREMLGLSIDSTALDQPNLVRMHWFRMERNKGRNAGRRIEYFGKIDVNIDLGL